MKTNVVAFLSPDICKVKEIARIEFEPDDINDKENLECINEQVMADYVYKNGIQIQLCGCDFCDLKI